jgi:GlcNAc-P-P-Und epimerase
MRRVLVTGGSGFIGTNLVSHLLQVGDVEVVNLDREPPRDPTHHPHWRRVDLLDRDALRRAVAEAAPGVVVHLAARTDLDGTDVADYAVNVVGVEHLIDAAGDAGVERVLFGSSQLVCTPGHRPADEFDYSPPNPYGRSKVLGEELVRERAAERFTWTLLRPTSIWGPWWGRLYSTFFRTVAAGRYLHPRGVDVHKSFGYVGNAVHRIEMLTRVPAERLHGRMLYLSDDEPYRILDWADEIAESWGRPPVRQVPLWVLRALAAGGDLAASLGWSAPPITRYRLRNICTDTRFDLDPLVELCGPAPIGRREGVERTVAWMRAHPDVLAERN